MECKSFFGKYGNLEIVFFEEEKKLVIYMLLLSDGSDYAKLVFQVLDPPCSRSR